LLVEPAELLEGLPPDSSPALMRLIRVHTPLKSLQTLAADADLNLTQASKCEVFVLYRMNPQTKREVSILLRAICARVQSSARGHRSIGLLLVGYAAVRFDLPIRQLNLEIELKLRFH